MRIAWLAEGQTSHSVCIPTGTDNTVAEAGVKKLFTTPWPLQVFMQLVAWAHKHKWHVVAAFASKDKERVSFKPQDFEPRASVTSRPTHHGIDSIARRGNCFIRLLRALRKG